MNIKLVESFKMSIGDVIVVESKNPLYVGETIIIEDKKYIVKGILQPSGVYDLNHSSLLVEVVPL